MKKIFFIIMLLGWFVSYNTAYSAITDPSVLDQYKGDTVIYGGAPTTTVQPNVLIILDTSGSMNDETLPGDPYNPATTYASANACGGQPCVATTVYKCTAFGLECGNWTAHVTNVSSVTTSCGGSNPYNSLTTTGQWNSSWRRLTTSGGCASGNGIYATGNWINWRQQVGSPRPKIDIAKEVVTNLVNSTFGVKFGLMIFDTTGSAGSEFFAATVSGSTYTATVKDMDAIFTGTTTNRQALVTAVSGITASGWTPLAESLYEAMLYYKGQASAFNSVTYTSPIEAECQKNFVIIVTDGMSTQDIDNVLQTICTNGDCDGDGFEPAGDPAKSYPNNGSDYLDDVAKYLYDNDMSTAFSDKQNVITYTVGFGLGGSNAGAVKLLNETAKNGNDPALNSAAFLSNDQQELQEALTQIMAQIFEVNTSFVAPVVPVNPENKVYSGERVYIGFFKPSSTGFWSGNLKKYGLGVNSSGNLEVLDKNGVLATDTTIGSPTYGEFLASAISYWTTLADGKDVDEGGVGGQLLTRSTARNIYTYIGNASLTDSTNAFITTNTGITAAILGVTDDTEKNKLINYVHGDDAYSNPGVKRDWILGDVLHSKPLVVQYEKYTFNTSNESNCSVNKNIIYVGANDGMLHAFKDCDGSELWGFIPPDKLGHLKYLTSSAHTYFVDGTPKAYIYDANKNGNLTDSGDKAILVFGERRGGQYYYALDVTDSANPKFMWRLAGSAAGANAGLLKAGSSTIETGSDTWFTELSETFSDPAIGKIKLSSSDKRMAMFISAGYDNDNQDLEPPSIVSADSKGRGIYAIEIADISCTTCGTPSFTNSGNKLWGYTNADNTANMTHSIPSTVRAIDVNDDTYIDRLYVGDTGGKMWRFNVKAAVSSWSGKLLFSSNTGSEKRKIFYEPAVTFEADKNNNPYEMLFFGTGDREHPVRTDTNDTTNPIQTDRMYAVKDKAQTYTITESYLTDVTTDELQALPGTSQSQIDCVLSRLGWQKVITGCDEQDGWYIKLDAFGANSEEKVLASATVFNQGAYYTTFAPDTSGSTNVCISGNLGTARVYGVHWRTGEAIINFDTTNDSTSTTNARAKDTSGRILLRSDRAETIGSGIPSQLTIIVDPKGAFGLVGVGGSIKVPDIKDEGANKVIYWRELF